MSGLPAPHPTLYRLRYDDGRPDDLLPREMLQAHLNARARAGLGSEGFEWDAWDILEFPGGTISSHGITYVAPMPLDLQREAAARGPVDLDDLER